jgi:nucleotide-binding universal stress UspA family protein
VRRWALGNVANKVVRATGKPVLLVRAKGTKPAVYRKSLAKVLVPVDGSRESEAVLKYITHIATLLDLKVTLFHIWEPYSEGIYFSQEAWSMLNQKRRRRESYVKRLEKRLKDKGVNVNSIFRKGIVSGVADEIIKLAEKDNYSMIAMATHGRSGVGRWIFGSNAQKILEEGSTPLFLIRPVKRRSKQGKTG